MVERLFVGRLLTDGQLVEDILSNLLLIKFTQFFTEKEKYNIFINNFYKNWVMSFVEINRFNFSKVKEWYDSKVLQSVYRHFGRVHSSMYLSTESNTDFFGLSLCDYLMIRIFA